MATTLSLLILLTTLVVALRPTQEASCNHPYFPLRPGAYWIYAPVESAQAGDNLVLREPTFEPDTDACMGLDCNRSESLWRVETTETQVVGPIQVTLTTVDTHPSYVNQDTALFECHNNAIISLETAADMIPLPSTFLQGEYIHLVSPELTLGHSWSGDNYNHAKRGGGMIDLFEWQTQIYTVIDTSPILVNDIPRAGLRILVTTIIVSQGRGYIGITDSRRTTSARTNQYTLTFAEGIGLVERSSDDQEWSLRLVETNLVE